MDPHPPDPVEVSIVHWIIGGIGGFFGAVGAGLLAIWRVATFTKGIRDELSQQRKDLDAMEADISTNAQQAHNEFAALAQRQDARHRENQDAIHALEVTLAKQPDKEDFRRLADYVRTSTSELKQLIESRLR